MFDINRYNCRAGKKPDEVYEKKQSADEPETNRFLARGQAEDFQPIQEEVDSHQKNYRKQRMIVKGTGKVKAEQCQKCPCHSASGTGDSKYIVVRTFVQRGEYKDYNAGN